MKPVIIRAALAAFLCLQLGTVYAVPVLFKTNSSVLVRTPQGIVAKPGIGELLSTVPTPTSSVKALGAFPFGIGNASVNIPVTKTFTGASIAAAAADAILSKTAAGLVATLALPYVIDAATDSYYKESQPQPTPTEQANNAMQTCLIDAAKTTAPYNQTLYYYVCDDQPEFQRVRQRAYSRSTNQLAATGYYPYPTGKTCTPPSVYDEATDMCLGSVVREPANAAQLAADIQSTFNDNPTFPKVALDATLDADIEPANGDQDIDMPTPQTIPGGSETSTRQYNDPATGHPVTEETTKQTDYQVERSAKNQLDVKPTVSTTTNITDNVTNITTTITNTSTTTPSEATTQQPEEKTDYTFNATQPEYDPAIDTPEKTPLEPVVNQMKNQINGWASGVGISATGGQCAMSESWGMQNASSTVTVSFCEWETQIGVIGIIILSFATLYGAFIIIGVKE